MSTIIFDVISDLIDYFHINYACIVTNVPCSKTGINC
jgi:hypothetical protein